MRYRKLGSTDLDIPVMCMGGLPRDTGERDRLVRQCMDLGINVFDTADASRGGEENLGEAVKDIRKDVIIATSFDLRPGTPDPTRMRRYAHRRRTGSGFSAASKPASKSCRLTTWTSITFTTVSPVAPEEILEPLNDLVKQGKARYIGENTYSAWRHAQTNCVAQANGWAEMVYLENYYAVTRRHPELELLPFCTENNVTMLVYHGLDYDFLTGQYGRGAPPLPEPTGVNPGRNLQYRMQDPRSLEILEELTEYGQDHGYSIIQLAYAWLLAHPAVCVMTGAENTQQLLHNVKAVDWEMTKDERDEIDKIAMWDGTSEEVEEPWGYPQRVCRREVRSRVVHSRRPHATDALTQPQPAVPSISREVK